ncbi:MAG: phosphocholine cytidylyltransferase family protein [Polyangiales bacterium]
MSPFTAIVLAAGVGSRLRPLTDTAPKCLVSVGRETMLGRAARVLADAGAAELIVSTGYLDGAVREAMRDAPLPVRFAHNHDYASTQNVVSLRRALDLAPDGRDVVKLDGDLVFERAVLDALFAEGGDACAAIEDGETPPDEAMKVDVAGGRITRFGKGLVARTAAGESIGVERFAKGAVPSLRSALAAAVEAGRTDVYYEEVYNDLLAAGLAMRAARVSSLRWCEVDDLDDLDAARRLFAGA